VHHAEPSQEQERLRQAREDGVAWRKWGPYLSERQWGTVREDYSANGDAWNSFPHDHARSRAYRWGEDGIAGFCDDRMLLCFSLALWNGRDPILKERLFGLTNSEGNHGEDVKEYYFYLDATPTSSYLKFLYKYPQDAFPYRDLVGVNGARSRQEMEYELLDTGVFDRDRYFDVFVEYAKAAAEEILIRISVVNRGPETAELRVLPHLWFRNTWWQSPDGSRPWLEQGPTRRGGRTIVGQHPDLGTRYLICERAGELLFTCNETNETRLAGRPNPTPYVKDGINDYIVGGVREAVDPAGRGTKAAAHYALSVGPGETQVVRLLLTGRMPSSKEDPFDAFDRTVAGRIREADEFYTAITPTSVDPDAALVMRQGFAGMLWTRQAFFYDLAGWLEERGVHRAAGVESGVRNRDWFHMLNADVISMPDKWEYPWYAAWDLAFHTLPLAVVDPDFAMQQLELMLDARYAHPNGQIPAYEWNFSDVNPPVHAWATLFNYRLQRSRFGEQALPGLRRAFHKLLLNFTWWLNRKDRNGRNVFEGGFLGLDNIGVFDRSAPLPTGGYLEQADGTAWMALFSQNMLEMSLELALHDPIYQDLTVKFYEHFVWIASAMDQIGDNNHDMWDETDGFYYDVLRLPDGSADRLEVRSMVGLLPFCAVTVYPEEVLTKLPGFVERVRAFNRRHPELLQNINPPGREGVHGRRMLSVLGEAKLRRVLARMLDPAEFLSDYGIRSLSRYHLDHPFVLRLGGQEYRVSYLPAESDSGMFGGNSNWRGPIWMPVNVLLIRALLQYYSFYGDDFTVECPTGSGRQMTLFEVARDLTERLERIFLRDENGRRPVYGATRKFQEDPHWRDLILFYEFFHGDNGAGIGASHQTGWTGLVSALISIFGETTAKQFLEERGAGFDRLARIHQAGGAAATTGA
jgi:Glycosyl hydrolase family 63 C-terminal domain